jgi:predicted polyphosphate/ATP-dependent NAD kinase
MTRTGTLRVDTGDSSLDEMLRGYSKVIIGYGKQQVVPVA